MFSDDEIKEMSENSFIQPGDEIISIHEVCLSDKFEKKDLALLSNAGRTDLDITRSLYRDGFFPPDQQARFAWTEEDDNIAALVSEPGFGTTGHTTFGKELEAALKSERSAEADASSSEHLERSFRSESVFGPSYTEHPVVSSTSTNSGVNSVVLSERSRKESTKVDKTDPRSRFHFVKYLKRHGRTVKIWECGICGREFQHQYTLIRHVPTHTDERNFHCDACGKSFRQLSTLSQHRAIHSADRPYSCDVCRKTFNRVSTLISHRKTHSNDKPYKCHLCPKGFHQKGNLRNHLFTHTNERPYRCNVCNKGFNQQSNLVCHKNKAHPEAVMREVQNLPPDGVVQQNGRSQPDSQPDSTILQPEQCEVTSSVGPYLPSMESPSTSTWNKWEPPECPDFWTLGSLGPLAGHGVLVEPIKTYHMGVAMATRQTPFALLKPDRGVPVLVKVVDTTLPGGKQMLVPATADDLRFGGKMVVSEKPSAQNGPVQVESKDGAVQIRVPVVATVVPKLRPGGRLQLAVEEPHHDYHTALHAEDFHVQHSVSVKVEGCSVKEEPPLLEEYSATFDSDHHHHPPPSPPPMTTATIHHAHDTCSEACTLGCAAAAAAVAASPARLPAPPPSPPLDLIPMDLFEHMDCIPIGGPQITAVDNMEQHPPSDDSDIFIGEFEESIALSDSD